MDNPILSYIGEGIKEFDEYLLPSDSIFGYYRSVTGEYHRELKKIHNQDITLSTIFLDIGNVNALSFIHNKTMHICMNQGTLLRLTDFYYKMWATPLMFPNIGICNPITELIIGDPVIIKNGVRYQTNPLDEARKHKADAMAMIAINFIILHELSHLHNGHNNYLQNKSGLRFLSMFSTNEHSIDTERSILEMDADSSSIRLLVMLGYLDDKYLNRYMTDKNDAIQFFLTAVSLLFRFLHNSNPASKESKEYLPVPFRLLTVYDELMRLHNQINSNIKEPILFPNMSQNKYEIYFSQIEDNVSEMINDVYDIGNDAFVDMLEDEELEEHYHLIRNAWPNIRNNLLQYSLMPLTNDYTV